MNEPIYHYTDGQGLIGILETGKIWCTHISYMNDSLEHKYGQTIYENLLSGLSQDPSLEEKKRRFAEVALLRLHGQKHHEAALTHPRRYFVASFSQKSDDLAQWRGYTGPSLRFAIGFEKSELARLHDLEGMALGKVDYDANAAAQSMREQFMSEIERLALEKLAPATNHSDPIYIHSPEFNTLNSRIIEKISPLLKHEKFKEEEEWRLYSDPASQRHQMRETEFRIGKSFLIPYVEIDLSKLNKPISCIIVGPTPHPEEARISVLRLIGTRGKKRNKEISLTRGGSDIVKSSDIPYRDW